MNQSLNVSELESFRTIYNGYDPLIFLQYLASDNR